MERLAKPDPRTGKDAQGEEDQRIVLAQLPVHPQYLDAGTSFNVNLLQPLNFGTEAVKPGAMRDIVAPRFQGLTERQTPLSYVNSTRYQTNGGPDQYKPSGIHAKLKQSD